MNVIEAKLAERKAQQARADTNQCSCIGDRLQPLKQPPESEIKLLEDAIQSLQKLLSQHICLLEPILIEPRICENVPDCDQQALPPLITRIRDCRMHVEKIAREMLDLGQRILF